jgi:flavodoxin
MPQPSADRPRVLVVYYSRGGHTRRVAQEIARHHGWRVERIADFEQRDGPMGWFRCAVEALCGARTELQPLREHPLEYDLVVVGTPVWCASLASPVRTYLAHNAIALPRVAFFATHGGTGAARVFRQMQQLAGKRPLGRLAVAEREIHDGASLARAREYADHLAAELGFVRRQSECPGQSFASPPLRADPSH